MSVTCLPSKNARLPRSRVGKMLVAVAVVWVFVVVVLFLNESVAPSPTATIKRDFKAASEWVNSYCANHGKLPSRDEFRRFLMRANSTDLLLPAPGGPTGLHSFALV